MNGWPGPHTVFPGFQVREGLDVHTSPSSGGDPAPVGDIRDGALVANQIIDLAVAKVLVQDAV